MARCEGGFSATADADERDDAEIGNLNMKLYGFARFHSVLLSIYAVQVRDKVKSYKVANPMLKGALMDAMTQRACSLLVASIALLIVAPSFAQNVRREFPSFNSDRTRFERAAERQGRSDWLQPPYSASGTQARCTFDFENADITLTTNKRTSLDELLEKAKKIALQLNLPKTDFIIWEGEKSVSVDMEFNKHLAHKSEKHTAFEIDLAALAKAMRAAKLPAPVVIGVETREADLVTLQTGRGRRSLNDYWFANIDEISEGSRVRWEAEIPWYAPLVLGGMALFLLGVPCSIVIAVRRAEKKGELRSPEEPVALSPEDVQKNYDRGKPQWVLMLPALLLPALFLLGNPLRILSASFRAVPESWFPASLALAIAYFLAALGYAFWRAKKRSKEASPEAKSLRVLMRFMMLMPLFFGALIFFRTQVHNAQQLALLRRFTLASFALMGAGLIVMLVRMRKQGNSLRVPLTEGAWHDMVQELAASAGVKVKKVVLIQSKTLNGFASLFGTVGLTSGLIEKMEPEEARVVIAHEIGHLKYGHVRRTAAVSFAILFLFYAALKIGTGYFGASLSEEKRRLLFSPIVFLPCLQIVTMIIGGRGRRKREEEADLFAVEQTGDPELVIRALTKLHTLNAMPHALKPSDEAFSSHPSLAHRIEAIRKRSRA